MEQQHLLKRMKRDFIERRDTEHRLEMLQQGLENRASKKLYMKNPKKLNDPDFKDQWYLVSIHNDDLGIMI